jgi:hypothetical protein
MCPRELLDEIFRKLISAMPQQIRFHFQLHLGGAVGEGLRCILAIRLEFSDPWDLLIWKSRGLILISFSLLQEDRTRLTFRSRG